MTYWQWLAYVEGWHEHVRLQAIQGVQNGFWAAYYANKKRPQSVQAIVRKYYKSKSQKSASVNQTIDIEAIEQDEAAFMDTLIQAGIELPPFMPRR